MGVILEGGTELPKREDLAYERRETETPYIYTEAKNMNDALNLALFAIGDAKSCWDYSKATGAEPVTTKAGSDQPQSSLAQAGYFVAGSATGIAGLLLLLLSLGVI